VEQAECVDVVSHTREESVNVIRDAIITLCAACVSRLSSTKDSGGAGASGKTKRRPEKGGACD
jgi:hypothetical protein